MADLHIIRIDDAKALVRVGVPEPERATPQEVRISVALALADPPLTSRTTASARPSIMTASSTSSATTSANPRI